VPRSRFSRNPLRQVAVQPQLMGILDLVAPGRSDCFSITGLLAPFTL